jgi:hypothetical protein
MDHPSYSPDLASYDFFLFPKMKTIMQGKHFGDVENIKHETTRLLKNLTSQDMQHCFLQWKKRWDKCIHSGGRVLWEWACAHSRIIEIRFLVSSVHKQFVHTTCICIQVYMVGMTVLEASQFLPVVVSPPPRAPFWFVWTRGYHISPSAFQGAADCCSNLLGFWTLSIVQYSENWRTEWWMAGEECRVERYRGKHYSPRGGCSGSSFQCKGFVCHLLAVIDMKVWVITSYSLISSCICPALQNAPKGTIFPVTKQTSAKRGSASQPGHMQASSSNR